MSIGKEGLHMPKGNLVIIGYFLFIFDWQTEQEVYVCQLKCRDYSLHSASSRWVTRFHSWQLIHCHPCLFNRRGFNTVSHD